MGVIAQTAKSSGKSVCHGFVLVGRGETESIGHGLLREVKQLPLPLKKSQKNRGQLHQVNVIRKRG